MQTKVNLLIMVEADAFDGKDMWSYDNDFARNVIFGVDNTSSSHTHNKK